MLIACASLASVTLAYAADDRVVIPAGSFNMGRSKSTADDKTTMRPKVLLDDRPTRQVSISSFRLDRYEVTNHKYREFVKATGHRAPYHWSADMPTARRPAAKVMAGSFAYPGLDRVLHEKARLGIMTSLVAHREGLTFTDLKDLCELTDGNLNRHLAVLEEVKLVATHRAADQGRPQTIVTMTRAGRRKFENYLSVLEQVLADAARRQERSARSRKGLSGFSPA